MAGQAFVVAGPAGAVDDCTVCGSLGAAMAAAFSPAVNTQAAAKGSKRIRIKWFSP
jgi:hypothetical protein